MMMEHTSTRGFAAIVQLLSDPAPPPPPPVHHHHHPPVNNPRSRADVVVVCPLPVRPVRAPCLVDNANGLVYCTGGSTTKGYRDNNDNAFFQHQAAEMELLDFLLQGGQDSDVDAAAAGFVLGTPPARTGNPIVNDAEFRKQSLSGFGGTTAASPAGSCCYSPYFRSATPSPRGERGSSSTSGSYGSSSASTFNAVPTTRVEGFPPSGSDPHPRRRVVSALA